MSDGPKKRILRKRHKISLRALAREIGISPQHLLDLEQGHRRFTDDMLERHDVALTKLATKNPALAKA